MASKKPSGWYWCCDETGLEANALQAIKLYTKRFGGRPGSIHVRPNPTTEFPKEIDGIPIIADLTVTPMHLFLVHPDPTERKE